MASRRLTVLHQELKSCRSCSEMVGPPVHGLAIQTKILLVGQAPGPHEGEIGKPFAWTAGKTLFKWLEQVTGADEDKVRQHVYFAAVARCFPGKSKDGSDRRPNPTEIESCRRFLKREVEVLRPKLILPVGTLAIAEVLGHTGQLIEVIGTVHRIRYHGVLCDVLPLPHPSGASTWHRKEPGLSLLAKALAKLAAHPAIQEAFR